MGVVNFELLKRFISYDPISGIFTRHTLCNADRNYILGQLINTDSGGYIIFSVLGESYLAHRLAFVFMGLEMPEIVDHINRVRDDNRWKNLRPCDRFVNAQNRSKPANNQSGCEGVIFDKIRGKFRTYIRFNGERYTAGRFTSFEDAVNAKNKLKDSLMKGKYVSRNSGR